MCEGWRPGKGTLGASERRELNTEEAVVGVLDSGPEGFASGALGDAGRGVLGRSV